LSYRFIKQPKTGHVLNYICNFCPLVPFFR